MADTPRSWSDLSDLLPVGGVQAISAQDLRDTFQSFRCFASMYFLSASGTAKATTTSGAIFTGWTAKDANEVGCTANATDGTITVPCDGIYEASFSVSSKFADNTTAMTMTLIKNGTGGSIAGTSVRYLPAATTLIHNLSMSAPISLAANDTLAVFLVGGSSNNVTIYDGHFMVKRIA